MEIRGGISVKISLEACIKALRYVYAKAESNPYITKPVSAALYKVWKSADEQEDEREIITGGAIDGRHSQETRR